MTSLRIHPADALRLRHWLRSNLVCVLAICGFLVLIGFQGQPPHELQAQTGAGNRTESTSQAQQAGVGVKSVSTHHLSMAQEQLEPVTFGESLESEPETLAHGRPVPVAPEGWRRTIDGWEHVSTWLPIARPLGEIVLEQEAREPIWVRAGLAKVRRVPPLAFAMLQIAAISAIVGIARTEQRKDPKQIVALPQS